jgi:hypothetical protein
MWVHGGKAVLIREPIALPRFGPGIRAFVSVRVVDY